MIIVNDEEYYSVAEFCEKTGYKPVTVYKWLNKKHHAINQYAHKIGNQTFINSVATSVDLSNIVITKNETDENIAFSLLAKQLQSKEEEISYRQEIIESKDKEFEELKAKKDKEIEELKAMLEKKQEKIDALEEQNLKERDNFNRKDLELSRSREKAEKYAEVITKIACEIGGKKILFGKSLKRIEQNINQPYTENQMADIVIEGESGVDE